MVECIVPRQFDIRSLPEFKEKLVNLSHEEAVEIDLTNVESMDAAACQFLLSLKKTKLNQLDKFIFKGFANEQVQKAMGRVCAISD